ncbi:MAG: prepilin-type N-terminal cleavage/methylation domain-containing protein [Gemmatimonadetes bacterium]|nr:prepilin-type N-terminal cleavage/methylation domain-containing protein [Gemmatimonadota bacterium]
MSSCSPSLGRRGFTLAELLISLVLGALIIGVVLQFVTGQTRLTAMQSGREEVQQNARGALEMVASDLRGAISAGVERGDADAIEVMLPRRWGLVCGQTGTTRTVVLFPTIAGQPTPVGADAGLLLRAGAGAWQPALPTRATVLQATEVDPAVACANLNPSGNVVAFQLDGANHPGVAAGSTAALYQRVRYDVRTSRGAQWIHRSNGMTTGGAWNMQPLAGPVDADAGGVSFTYFTGTPPVALANAPGVNASTSNLSQVRLRVRMKSRAGGTTPQVEFDSATVQLRNYN